MTEDLDQYAAAYGSDSPYALDNRLILNWYPRRVLQLTPARDSLLELGIGHGYVSNVLGREFRRHVIIEGSPEMIRKYREGGYGSNTEIIEAFFEEWQSPERFDVIVMGFVLEHVENPAVILDKYRENLAEQGSLFIAVPNYEALNKRLGYAAGMMTSLAELTEEDVALGHRRLFSLASLRELVDSAGYREIAVEGIFLKPVSTQQLIDLNLSEDILRATLEVGVAYPELCVAMLMEVKP
jgi:2-polyprenyl-3-methyl-5-hydroxy-6-metoxy-1,4-benzoquinol methylase